MPELAASVVPAREEKPVLAHQSCEVLPASHRPRRQVVSDGGRLVEGEAAAAQNTALLLVDEFQGSLTDLVVASCSLLLLSRLDWLRHVLPRISFTLRLQQQVILFEVPDIRVSQQRLPPAHRCPVEVVAIHPQPLSSSLIVSFHVHSSRLLLLLRADLAALELKLVQSNGHEAGMLKEDALPCHPVDEAELLPHALSALVLPPVSC
mmetsp:Transcript_11899/g.41014  ORF Transcript_11899/g.41014 Transcript_11899/m.41014 type:complete len:207 (-) Transcript_11899:586-1206(-)